MGGRALNVRREVFGVAGVPFEPSFPRERIRVYHAVRQRVGRQRILIRARRIAEGDSGLAVAVLQAVAALRDGFLPLGGGLPAFGFDDDAMRRQSD